MNKLLKTFSLAALFALTASVSSSAQGTAPQYKNDGLFTARIDGKNFVSRGHDKYTAAVSNQSDYSKHEQGADLTFFGGKFYDANGNAFEESLEFKYAFSEATTGDVSGQKIVFQFDNQKFLSIPGQTKIHITQVHYNADRTALVVSADFEGKMLQWVAPGQSQPIVHVKGKMENINVTIPTLSPTAEVEF